MRRLERLGELEEERVLATPGRELHAQGKPDGAAPERQRNRRCTGDVVERCERRETCAGGRGGSRMGAMVIRACRRGHPAVR